MTSEERVEALLRHTYLATTLGPLRPDERPAAAAGDPRPPRRFRTALTALAAAGAASAVIAVVVAGNHSGGATTVQPTTSSATSRPGLWLVAGWGSGPLVKIDPATSRVIETVELDGSNLQKAVPAFGRLWVTVGQSGPVLSLDPGRGTVERTVPLGAATDGLATDGRLVWVAVDDRVVALDPTTGSRVRSVAVSSNPGGPGELDFDGAALWLSMSGLDEVWRIDPGTATVTAKVRVGHTPDHLVFDGRWVWVGNGRDNTLSRIDPRSATVTATVRLGPADPAAWVGSPTAMVRVGTQLWVVHDGGAHGTHLSRVDGTAVTLLDASWPCCTASAVTDGRHVWFGSDASGTRVIAVDTTTLASVSVFSRPYPTPS